MSNDFLSKFSGKNYDDLLEKDRTESKDSQVSTKVPLTEPVSSTPSVSDSITTKPDSFKTQLPSGRSSRPPYEAKLFEDHEEEETAEMEPSPRSQKHLSRGQRYETDDLYEVDPSYNSKQVKKKRLLILSAIMATLLLAFLGFKLTHVAIPNFEGKSISEAREWGIKNNVTFDMTQEFNLEQEVNYIISQSAKAKKQIRKGSTIGLVVSKGADPEEVLKLPNFDTLSAKEAEAWITEHRAENIILKKEYSDTIEANRLIRFDINSSDVTEQDYKRGDKATLIYSRGKENLEKNIEVPDFTGKEKSEVESWAKKNEIKLTYTDQASDSIAAGQVISQSTAPQEKVAKKDTIEIFLSVGKGITVPDFATLTPEAAANANGLTVTVQYQFNPNLRYGSLISQSIEAGKQLAEKESKNILVIYSQGTPYLKDIRGKKSSELAKYFFDEYQSRGAEVTYETYWVNSAEPRGTVVEQSDYEVPIAMNYHVYVGISNGVWASSTIIPEVPVDNGLGSSGQTNEIQEMTE
ncbi:PASTA domain-containing protein [Streptococcus rifensis]